MNKSSYPLKLPISIKQAAQHLAKQDGVSLNQWISVAIAEKIGVVETAALFLKRKAGESKPEDLNYFLDKAPDNAPMLGDER